MNKVKKSLRLKHLTALMVAAGCISNPVAGQTVIIGDTTTETVFVPGSTITPVDILILGNTASGNGTLNFSGGTLTLDQSIAGGYSGYVTVGNSGVGTINQSNSAGNSVININGPQYVGPAPGDSPDPWGGYLFVGRNNGSAGTYTMVDNTFGGNSLELNVQREIQIGGSNVSEQAGGGFSCLTSCSGSFAQDGGVVTAGGVTIGIGNGTGSYTISSGALNSFIDLGNTATGTFEHVGGTVTAGGMFIGNGSSGNGTYNLNGGTLNSGSFVLLGAFGTGTITQNAGDHNAQQLLLGSEAGGNGFYNLNDGALTIGSGTTDQLVVGHNGTGTFTMTGGTLVIQNQDINTAAFVVGNNSGAVGTFTQSGGAVDGGRALAIGLNGGTGTYNLNTDTVNLSTPTLTTGFIALGNNSGQGTFNQQTATSNTTGSLFIGGQGTYNLDGGTLDVGTTIGGQGSIVGTSDSGALLNQTGGTHTTNTLIVGNRSDSSGTYSISGGDLIVSGQMFVGRGHDSLNSGTLNGLFQQSAGSVDAAQIFVGGFAESATSYYGAGRYELSGGTVTSAFTAIGWLGQGSVLQTAGTFNAGELQLGSSGLFSVSNGNGGFDFYSSGTYDLKGGVLNATSTTVSVFGLGTFNQSDGDHNVSGNLTVGSQPGLIELNSGQVREGVYKLSGGNLTVVGNVTIGAGNGVNLDPGFPGEPGALGTFIQSGGTHLVGGDLKIGQSGNVAGGTGLYTLSSGVLTVSGNTFIGGSGLPDGLQDGIGTFTQTGGTHTTLGDMNVGGGLGTYNLSGTGVLNTGITYVNSDNGSSFNQSGGTHNTGYLNVYGGDYLLSGGTINVAGNMGVGGPFNSARVTQSGGEVFVNDPTFGLFVGGFGGSGKTGTYTLSSGTLTVAATTHVGSDAVGTFNQTGGTHTTSRLVLGENVGGNGTYNLSGGTLNDSSVIGDAGVGVMNTSGGTHNVTGDLILGNQATGNGTYKLSSTGQVVVSGSTTVGGQGTGALNISDTGSFTGTGFVRLGSAPGSQGGLVLSDAGSLSINYTGTGAQLLVGDQGTGTVVQTGTSSVTTGSLRVGVQNGSTGTYTMGGGTLTVQDGSAVAGGMRIALAGNGTFTQNNGAVSAAYVQIGGANFGQGSGGTGVYNLNGGTLSSSGAVDVNVNSLSTGTLNVAGGALTAPLIINNDKVNYSGGSIAANVNNNANFNVSGGAARTLTGDFANNTGGTLAVAAATPLTVSGVLTQAAGASIKSDASITVGKDYHNLTAGSGNSFDRHAGVTNGAGGIFASQIIGANAAQTITGNVAAAGTDSFTLDLGNVRGGSGPVTKNYQIANNGSGADIRGAIQTAGANGGNITDARLSGTGVTAANFGPIVAGGNSGDLSVTLSGPGAALSGQKVAIVSNFDNVATKVINLTGGAVSALAVGNATPNSPSPVDLGNFRIGTAGANTSFSVQNQTTGAGAEQLGINSALASSGFAANNAFGAGLIGPGASANGAITAQASGTGAAGVNNGTVTINYATDGTNIDAAFTRQASNQQVINVSATGYNAAVGSTTPTPVTFTNRHVGDAASQLLTVQNTAPTGLFSEALNASFAASTGNLTNNGGSVVDLKAGSNNNSAMSVTLDTSAAGARSGSVTIAYATDGTGSNGNSGLAAMTAGSQVIDVSGNVYRLAAGNLTPTTLNFGTVQVGQVVASQNLTITNTASGPAGFVEHLDASFGTPTDTRIVGNNSISLLAAGANSTAMSVGLNTNIGAGLLNGTIAVNYVSNGSLTSGLGLTGVGSQNVTVTGDIQLVGNVILQANPSAHAPEPVNLGNVRLGGSFGTQALSMTNVQNVNGDAQAALNASIAPATGPVTATGSFNLLNPGSTDNSSLVVGLAAGASATAGAKSGTATIALVSDASNVGGCSPNCQMPLPSQTVTINGGAYQVAQPSLPTDVNLGNLRIGDSRSQAITIGNTNNAPAGFQEGLNANVGATVNATGSGGPITNLAAGATSNAISVGLAAATAGNTNAGAVTINLATNGDGTSGLGVLSLPDATVNLTATGYRTANNAANPVLTTGAITLAARVGDATPMAAISITNSSPDAFTEGLKVDRGSTAAGFSSSGSIANLAAAGMDSTSVKVALATGTAGTFSGSQVLNFTSTGVGTTGAPDLAVGSASVVLTGNVYQQAVGQVNGTTVDFGIVHVGDPVANHNLSVANVAPVVALNDTLAGSLVGVSGPFNANGNLAGLGAGQTDTTSLAIGLNTSAAGVFNDAATVNFLSQNPDMAALDIEIVALNLVGTVNNYAKSAFTFDSGAGSFAQNGLSYTLNFGTLFEGSGLFETKLLASNDVLGPADLLDGDFQFADSAEFGEIGFADFLDFAAGDSQHLLLTFDTSSVGVGSYSNTILLKGAGHNASGYRGAVQDITLVVQGTVVERSSNVPEPGNLLLVLTGLLLTASLSRRTTRAPVVGQQASAEESTSS